MGFFSRLFESREQERERIVKRLLEIEETSVWHSEPDYEQLVERLAKIDGARSNGHYHWRCILHGTPEEREKKRWEEKYRKTGMPCNVRIIGYHNLVKCQTCGREGYFNAMPDDCPKKNEKGHIYTGNGVSELGVIRAMLNIESANSNRTGVK